MVDAYTTYRSSHYSSQHSSNSNHPSFSSTLLDSIYRSIDQGEDEIVVYREAMRIKHSYSSECSGANVRLGFHSEEEMANFRRACMIEKWMEKKVSENGVVWRKSATDSEIKKSRKNSSSSSFDSSYGGGFFSASGTEAFQVQRLKPVRTGEKIEKNRDFELNRRDQSEQKSKREGGFLKTKSRALKIYGDLKKAKQPISPGGKVAAFLNSIFTGKPKITSNDDVSPSLKTSTTCSSASSFSRSCLSKTPSSRGKSSNGPKRSVRFSPVSMIIDDDDHHKSNNKASNLDAMEKNRRIEEAARDLIKNYQKKIHQSENVKSHIENRVFDRDFEEDDDDVASCASSDLFELDNLSAIGMDRRYNEELPVYETTHLRTNRAIANGLIL